jgi:hypothetical protein
MCEFVCQDVSIRIIGVPVFGSRIKFLIPLKCRPRLHGERKGNGAGKGSKNLQCLQKQIHSTHEYRKTSCLSTEPETWYVNVGMFLYGRR